MIYQFITRLDCTCTISIIRLSRLYVKKVEFDCFHVFYKGSAMGMETAVAAFSHLRSFSITAHLVDSTKLRSIPRNTSASHGLYIYKGSTGESQGCMAPSASYWRLGILSTSGLMASSSMSSDPAAFCRLPSFFSPLFGFIADSACSPRFQNSIFLRGRPSVVLFAPEEVPRRCDNEEGAEDNRCVVHVIYRYRNEGRHAEKREGESRPA